MTSKLPAQVMHQLIDAGLAAIDSEARNYLLGGAESEATVTRNRAAITRRALRPRVLQDVNDASLITSVLGVTSVGDLKPAHIAVCPNGRSHPAFPHLDFKDDLGRNIVF